MEFSLAVDIGEQVAQNTTDIAGLRELIEVQVQHSQTIIRQNWTLITIIVTGFFGLAAVAL